MIEDVYSVDLPVGEKLSIKRNRYTPNSGTAEGLKRISIVTGIHGDELEGQYVCYLLNDFLQKNKGAIRGVIDIYPAANPLGLDSITRGFPFYEVDLNRQFPGSKNDFLPSQVTDGIVEAAKGSDIAVDIHSSNIFLREIPQVRIASQFADTLVPLAKLLNIDFIWIHDAVTVLESTFAHAMNGHGCKTLVVEMGVGMRITEEYGKNLLKGLLNLMRSEGILDIAPVDGLREPMTSEVGDVSYINADAAGIFVPVKEHSRQIKEGELVGYIYDPLEGQALQEVLSPSSGILFTVREYPIVYEGSLLARIFGGQK